MTAKDWLIVCIAAAGSAVLLMSSGCTMKAEATFIEPGVYECKARSPGYEDLPVYTIDSETADPKGRYGIGAPHSISVTTIEGERITLSGGDPAGYYCVKLETK